MADDFRTELKVAGSNESGRGLATRFVKSRYLKDMEKIPYSLQEFDHLIMKEDIEAKFIADNFEHFIKMSEGIPKKHGTLEKNPLLEDFYHLAATCGWETTYHEDYAKATLEQQDKVIASILIFKLAKYQNLALTYPKEQIGLSWFLLRGIMDKLVPAAVTGLSTGLLWENFDQLRGDFDKPTKWRPRNST